MQGFDVAEATRHEARPVIESLAVMALRVFATLLQFHEHDGFPDLTGKRNATAVLIGFAHAKLGLPVAVEGAELTEGLE